MVLIAPVRGFAAEPLELGEGSAQAGPLHALIPSMNYGMMQLFAMQL